MIDVTARGAVADGITDITAIIQACDIAGAIIQLPYVGTGVYVVDGTLSFSHAERLVIDPGVTLKLKANAGDGAKIITIHRDGFAVEAGGATLDGNRRRQSSTMHQRAIHAKGRSHVRIVLGRLTNCARQGMWLEDMAHSSVHLDYGDLTGNQLVLWYTSATGVLDCCYTWLGFGDRSDDPANNDGLIEYNTYDATNGYIQNCTMDVAGKMAQANTGTNNAAFEIWGPGRNNTIRCRSIEGGEQGCSIARQKYGLIIGTAYQVRGQAFELADCSYSQIIGTVYGNGVTDTGAISDGTNIGADGNTIIVSGDGVTGQLAFTKDASNTTVTISGKLTEPNSIGLRSLRGSGTQGYGVIDCGNTPSALPLVWDAADADCSGGGFRGSVRNGAAQALQLLATSGSWNKLKFDLNCDNCTNFLSTTGTHGSEIDIAWNGKTYGNASSGRFSDFTKKIADFIGTGNPEGSLAAGVGSTFTRTNGEEATSRYLKVSGTDATGWRAVGTFTDSAENIASAAASINTTDKYQGKAVYDITNHQVWVADGSDAIDPWYVADGSASITPS